MPGPAAWPERMAAPFNHQSNLFSLKVDDDMPSLWDCDEFHVASLWPAPGKSAAPSVQSYAFPPSLVAQGQTEHKQGHFDLWAPH